jgi:hypothetical protein
MYKNSTPAVDLDADFDFALLQDKQQPKGLLPEHR